MNIIIVDYEFACSRLAPRPRLTGAIFAYFISAASSFPVQFRLDLVSHVRSRLSCVRPGRCRGDRC
jgi:hypothetical protein